MRSRTKNKIMKRKIGEIFKSEYYGKTYRVEKSTLHYPLKCKDCDLYTKNSKWGMYESGLCNGILNETGDCRPRQGEIRPVELIFKEVK